MRTGDVTSTNSEVEGRVMPIEEPLRTRGK